MGRKGDGSIEELPSGRFRAVVSMGVNGAGKRIRRSKTFKTVKAAQAWKRDQLALVAEGRTADPGRRTLAEWLDDWLAGRKGDLEPRGYEPYEQQVRVHLKPAAGATLLRDLKPARAKAIIDGLDCGRVMRRRLLATLRQACVEAVRLGLLPSDPTEGIKLTRPPRAEFAVWTAEQSRQFLAAASGHALFALFALALDSGMRQGELLALAWDAVDLDARTVEVRATLESPKEGDRRAKPPKTKAGRRRVVIAAGTADALRRHREAQKGSPGLVFPDANGGWLNPSNVVNRAFLPLAKRAGLPRIRFHDLRHTCATLLLMAGVNIKAVSVRLGHASIQVTLDTYSHYLPEMDSRISAAVQATLYGPPAGRSPTVVPRHIDVGTSLDGPTDENP